MAMFAPMVAAGEYAGLARGTALGVAAVGEAVSWAPVGYGAYRYYEGSSIRDRRQPSAMTDAGYIPFQGSRKRHHKGGPYNTRKGSRFVGPSYQKFIAKKSNVFKANLERPIAQKMNMGSETVALHKLVTLDLVANTDKFFCLQIADILNAPALSRYTRLYDRMRFISLKLEAFATDYVTTMITSVSQSEKVEVSDKDTILRQPSCRFHSLKRSDGVNCSRTLHIADVAGLGDHIPTSALSDPNTISLTNATTFDCGIHGGIIHTDAWPGLGAGGMGVPGQKVQLKYVFVVQFMGQKQTMAAGSAEAGP